MATRQELERRAAELASRLTDELVESSERVDHRQGTFLLAALAAELGQRAQNRCWEQASRSTGRHWEIAASEAETLITAAWRCMETIAASSNQFQDDPPA
jgi:hypothetical protein